MKRRLGKLITSVSLLLLVATAAQWIRSYLREDSLGVDTVQSGLFAPDHVTYLLSMAHGSVAAVRQIGVFGMPTKEVAALPQTVGQREWWHRTRAAAVATSSSAVSNGG